MKKKITSLFAMMLMFVGAANAQVVEELQGNKVVSFGDQVASFSDVQADKWYVLYQSRGGGGLLWDHYKTEDPGHVDKCQGVEVISSDPENPSVVSQVAEYMVRFISTEQEGVYNIQFGTGRYIMNLENETGNSQRLRATASAYDAAKMGIYNIVTTTDGVETVNDFYFGINFMKSDGSYGKLVDNNDFANGVATVVTWNDGQHTSTEGNSVWEIYEVIIDDVGEKTIVWNELSNTYQTYYGKTPDGGMDYTTEPAGAPGTYDAEKLQLFVNAVTAAEEVLWDDPESYTVEQLTQLTQNILDTYQAFIDSKTPLAMDVAEGYYLIQTSPFFYYTTEDTTDPETGETITGETVYTSKGLCALPYGQGIFAAWASYDATADTRAVFLWKVTKKDGKKYQLRNMGYDVNAAFWNSSNLQLEDADSTVVFDYNPFVEESENGAIPYYNIRPSNSPEGDYYYVHAGGHSSGAGIEDWIVKWQAGDGKASEWKLVPVSEEDAQAIIAAFAPIKDEEGRISKAQTIIADVEPKMIIAVDNSVEIEGEGLITNVNQLSSPYTETPEREPGSGLEMLIDGNVDTYWHSSWASQVAGGTHYLQVQLTDPSAVTDVAYEMTRRHQAANDHPTVVSVYGTNDSEAEKDACTLLGTVETPLGSVSETVTSQVFPTGGFTYLRFYADDTAGSGITATRGYWHAAEFQLYAAKTIVNETSQAIGMGEVFTNMQTAVEQAKTELGAEESTISVETYNQLQEAYEAFIAMYVNPDTLRNKIAATEGIENYVVIGNNPGQWKDDTTAEGITNAVATAKAYDKAGKYSLAESQAQIAALDAAKETMLNAANKIETGKWYKFQFATDEMYTEYEWDRAGAEANVNTETGAQTWPALFGRYVCVGEQINDGTEEAPQNETIPAEATPAGTGLYYMDESNVEDDMAMFRFISIGDSAYVIQNKGTGLFLYTPYTGAITLQPAATTWKAQAMGCGKVMVTGHNPEGANVNHLHAQRNGNSLVTWGADGIASNTGFLVHEIEDVAENYDGSEFQISMAPNSMASFCYPTAITATEGELYGVYIEGTEVTLTKLENQTAEAGQPFIYINGDPEAYDAEAEAEAELVSFTHGNDIVAYPDTTTKHVGTFYGATVTKGNVLVKANGIEVAKSVSNSVNAFSSYIKAELDTEAVLNVTVSDEIYDSIQKVVSQAVKGGDIYTIDGKFVGKGNLSTKLSRGAYIINGVKVIVK